MSEEKIFGPKGEKKRENCVMSSFIIFTPHLILLGWQGRSDEQGMWHAWREEKCMPSFDTKTIKGGGRLQNLGMD